MIIGVAGRAHHGKDLVAGAITSVLRKRGYGVYTRGISHFILCEAQDLGFIPYGKNRVDLDPAEVALLVQHGLKMNILKPRHWTDLLAADYRKSGLPCAVLTGRLSHEQAAWLKESGGKLVLVQRFDATGRNYHVASDRNPEHLLEAMVDKLGFDYLITHRTGQLRWLIRQAVALGEELSCR